MGAIFGGLPAGVRTQYATPTTGQTVTAGAGVNTLFLDPAGTLATLTVELPTGAVEGQMFTVASSRIITILSVTGTIVGALTTLALGGFARFCYSANSSKWFRVG